MLERRCAQGQVALLIDELQWADAGTLLVVHRLCQATTHGAGHVVGHDLQGAGLDAVEHLADDVRRRDLRRFDA